MLGEDALLRQHPRTMLSPNHSEVSAAAFEEGVAELTERGAGPMRSPELAGDRCVFQTQPVIATASTAKSASGSRQARAPPRERHDLLPLAAMATHYGARLGFAHRLTRNQTCAPLYVFLMAADAPTILATPGDYRDHDRLGFQLADLHHLGVDPPGNPCGVQRELSVSR
jgi:hypothetical protein